MLDKLNPGQLHRLGEQKLRRRQNGKLVFDDELEWTLWGLTPSGEARHIRDHAQRIYEGREQVTEETFRGKPDYHQRALMYAVIHRMLK